MRHEDFFTGEVLPSTSPNSSSDYISEVEAIQNASFGKYDYDPGARMVSQPLSLNPGGYGYNSFGPNYMNPPVNPYYGGAPVNYGYNYGMMPPPNQEVQFQYFIKPVNFSGEYLPPIGFEEEIEKLKMEYWKREQEIAAKNGVNNQNTYNPYYGQMNYYGVPYVNPYQYNSLYSEIQSKISELEEQAKDNRKSLNIRLSKLAHNIIGEEYSDAAIEERYTGKHVDCGLIPITYGDIYLQTKFANLVPFDNSQIYREHNDRISREFNAIIPKGANLKECFDNSGILYAHYELEEEQHRRRDGKNLYDDNSYKYFVREKAAQRYAQKKGLPLVQAVNQEQQFQQTMLSGFPTLAESAKLTEDGTLNITCNFGSRAGQVYSVHNSEEAGYEQDRQRFQQFIDSIPHSIYLDSPNGD